MAANIDQSGKWVNGIWQPDAAPAIIPGLPGLPNYGTIPGVNELFSPMFGRTETITRGAENAIAGGFGMGGFAQNQTNQMLDSERKANWVTGHQILEPYLQRDFQGAQNAAERQARMDQIAAEGAQALQRLQLSEAGEGQRLTQREEAEARRQVIAGQQAMQQLTVREAGDTSRQNTQIRGQLANTLLSGILSGKGKGVGGGSDNQDTSSTAPGWATSVAQGGANQNLFYSPRSDFGAASRSGSTSLGLGSSSIDALLRKYNLL